MKFIKKYKYWIIGGLFLAIVIYLRRRGAFQTNSTPSDRPPPDVPDNFLTRNQKVAFKDQTVGSPVQQLLLGINQQDRRVGQEFP